MEKNRNRSLTRKNSNIFQVILLVDKQKHVDYARKNKQLKILHIVSLTNHYNDYIYMLFNKDIFQVIQDRTGHQTRFYKYFSLSIYIFRENEIRHC